MRPDNLKYIETITDINGRQICFYRTGYKVWACFGGEIPLNEKIELVDSISNEQVCIYFKNGFLHRNDGPAIEGNNFIANIFSDNKFFFNGISIELKDLIEIYKGTDAAINLMALALGNKEQYEKRS